MSLHKNVEYAALVKNEYLPPPLQMNYLSLFDIQVKMAKEFLQGTQQEKVNIIKKRIKKFFDYGNDQTQPSKPKLSFQGSNQKQYPPLEVDSKRFHLGLEIDSTKLIIYGKGLNLNIIEKLFHGFISSQKIDDCNYKLEYVSEKIGQQILYENVREKTSRTTHRIFNPLDIEWFQIQPLQELNGNPTYVRYSTNKDDILFRNDLYFRRLLGKVRQSYDLRRLKQKQVQKEIQESIEIRRFQNKKKKFIYKHNVKKNKFNESESDTNYDGEGYRSYYLDRSRDYEYKNSKRKSSRSGRSRSRSIQRSFLFGNLNVSQIRPTPIELERSNQEHKYRGSRNDSSVDSIDFCNKNYHKRGRQRVDGQTARNKLIQEYRQRSVSPNFVKSMNLQQYDYNRSFDRQIQRITSRGNKMLYKID